MGTAAGPWWRLQFTESLKTCPYNERAEFSGYYRRKLVSPLFVLTTSFNLDTESVQEYELDTKINRKFKFQVLHLLSWYH